MTASATATAARTAEAAWPKPAMSLLRCPVTGSPLRLEGEALVSPEDRRYPIVHGVPRFVESDGYVGSFSFEWLTHDTTQLDSVTGSSSSETTLREKTGLAPEDVRGKLVLDAGVGVGRFSDVLVRWGAHVVGVDLSASVEAAQRNLGHLRQALFCQADIASLPFAPDTFDAIVSIGVLHHTSDTRRHFLALARHLKPGGVIAIWVYPRSGEYALRSEWVPLTSRVPSRLFHGFCKVLVHWMSARRGRPLERWINSVFPISNQGLGLENDILDTFDAYSPRYHGIHDPEEVVGWFREAGLEQIEVLPWDTSVRGRRPLAEKARDAAPRDTSPTSPDGQAAAER